MSSRVGRKPVDCPKGVEVTLSGNEITIKGAKGKLSHTIHESVSAKHEEGQISFVANDTSSEANALTGTTRALVNNMVVGVTEGFEKKLELVGVGYRAQAQGKKLNLSLGFSHPVVFDLPEEVTAETPSQTQIVLKSINKQVIGQAAANIRSIRPPEPYKGKGIRYADEQIVRKEAKKK